MVTYSFQSTQCSQCSQLSATEQSKKQSMFHFYIIFLVLQKKGFLLRYGDQARISFVLTAYDMDLVVLFAERRKQIINSLIEV
jgi:hypothetical protein